MCAESVVEQGLQGCCWRCEQGERLTRSCSSEEVSELCQRLAII